MQRKYGLNDRVFDVITPESAYWIGYLYGDGNCTQENKVRMFLAWEDKDLAYSFRDFIGSIDRPIKEVRNQWGQYAAIEFRSWRVHNIIRKYGLTKCKKDRGSVHPDLLQYDVAPDFIRGVFDADGCFYYDGNHKNHLFAEITGYMPLLKCIKNVLVSRGVINEGKKIVKNGSVFRIRFAKIDCAKLIYFLYGNNPKYFLKRKYGIAKDHLDRLNDSTSGSQAKQQSIVFTTYHRPVSSFNIGKQGEFAERKYFVESKCKDKLKDE